MHQDIVNALAAKIVDKTKPVRILAVVKNALSFSTGEELGILTDLKQEQVDKLKVPSAFHLESINDEYKAIPVKEVKATGGGAMRQRSGCAMSADKPSFF